MQRRSTRPLRVGLSILYAGLHNFVPCVNDELVDLGRNDAVEAHQEVGRKTFRRGRRLFQSVLESTCLGCAGECCRVNAGILGLHNRSYDIAIRPNAVEG